MKAQEKLITIERKALLLGKRLSPSIRDYPTDILDLIIFHKLHLAMPLESAIRSFRNLKAQFVDWNEVRVSTLREIQEEIGKTPDSLSLAVFIKDLLEFVHHEHQNLSLEFLAEQNLGEIRRYLKQVRGLDNSTVNLILRVRKEHPVLPLNRATETVVDRLGILRKSEKRDRKERVLHELVNPEKALFLHHFLLNHSQEYCPPDEASVDCARCCVRHVCAFYEGAGAKARRRSTPRQGGGTSGANGAGSGARAAGKGRTAHS